MEISWRVQGDSDWNPVSKGLLHAQGCVHRSISTNADGRLAQGRAPARRSDRVSFCCWSPASEARSLDQKTGEPQAAGSLWCLPGTKLHPVSTICAPFGLAPLSPGSCLDVALALPETTRGCPQSSLAPLVPWPSIGGCGLCGLWLQPGTECPVSDGPHPEALTLCPESRLGEGTSGF